jgi:ATP-independent RNA helicase DbpA
MTYQEITLSESSSFGTLPLAPAMLDNLSTLGFTEMTPIQAASLPALLEGRDVIAQAETGSGKTVAFGLSLLHRLDVKRFRVQGLVLCPTRELALQVAEEVRRLARFTHNVKVLALCGGMPLGPQIGSLAHQAHIVVGTPGRIRKHLSMETLSLEEVQTLVLDEADRMLDMGFEEEVQTILAACPEQRQTLLFSATYPDDIRAMSDEVQSDPLEVVVSATSSPDSIAQFKREVESTEGKIDALVSLLHEHRPSSCLVFCNMKIVADELADALHERGFVALALHGDLEQRERQSVLVRFANGSTTILVATDVAARGLDIEALPMVIHYDLALQPEVHIHRTGRTGRAGQSGLVVSLVGPKDKGRLQAIESYVGEELPVSVSTYDPTRDEQPLLPEMITLQLDGGKKRKVRPGDILGALTKDAGLPGKHIGKIDIFDQTSFVAVHRSIVHPAFKQFRFGKLKGRQFRVRRL